MKKEEQEKYDLQTSESEKYMVKNSQKMLCRTFFGKIVKIY